MTYRGLGYVEAKTDARTGRLLIIEPNIGRPTGRSAIAERGGVELLLTAYRDALGEPLPEARVQRYQGAKWIYWRHDLQASVVRLSRGELTVGAWWRSVQGSPVEAVFARRDLAPFAADLTQTARTALADGPAPARRPDRRPEPGRRTAGRGRREPLTVPLPAPVRRAAGTPPAAAARATSWTDSPRRAAMASACSRSIAWRRPLRTSPRAP